MKTPRNIIASLSFAAIFCFAATVAAREGHPETGHQEKRRATDGPRMEPAFFQQLYPAEVVMRHADAIRLSDEQKAAIRSAMPQVGKSADRERQSTEARKLEQLLKTDQVDETQAISQLNKLLEVEDDFKRRQLRTLIQIKNILTPEQRLKIEELRNAHSGSRQGEEPRFGTRESSSK